MAIDEDEIPRTSGSDPSAMRKAQTVLNHRILAGMLLAMVTSHAVAEQIPPLHPQIVDRALVDAGDPARLQHVMDRARRGEPITFAVIGGSITEGAGSSKPETRWANLVHAWWQQTFPNAEVRFINAGIGATGSDYGAFRVQRDLLKHAPDVVVVEFAVNDGSSPRTLATTEGLIRQILKQPNHPALLQLFTMTNQGGNTQDDKTRLGRHYGLPMTSYRDALWPEVESKRIAFGDITADVIHPNDRGHRYAADFVIALLEKHRADLPATDALPAIAPVPEPLASDLYEHTIMWEANRERTPLVNGAGERLTPVRTEHVNLHNGQYRLLEPGRSEIEFEIPAGKSILVQTVHTSNFYGARVEARVNDRAPTIIDTLWSYAFDGLVFHVLADDLGPGPHRVRLKLIEKHPDARPAPQGAEYPASFVIARIGVAGARPAQLRDDHDSTP